MDESLLAELNPAQREAVTTIEGPLLVVAGPGSGKTRVITRRVAWLVACGAAPWEICAVTFTNRAAGEMKQRVAELTDGMRGFWISTFHSMCARILRRSIEPLGWSGSFTIYDEHDRARAVAQVVKAREIDTERWRTSTLAYEISEAKNRLLDPAGYAEQAYGEFEDACAEAYLGYQALLQKNNALDFDDLLMKTVELFYQAPDVLADYRRRFRHLMVDEFQDTNLAQYEIARLLALEHRNFCITGDPDQSIYSWRGAHAGNLKSFEEEFPEARTVLLDTSYRSTQAILAAADSLINHNPGRKISRLVTPNPPGLPVALIEAASDRDEARAIVQQMLRLIREEALCLADFAVFYRINALSRLFEQVLMQAGLEYEVVGAIAFYERREVKDLLAYLALLANPADDLSLARIINVPRRKIGAATVQRLTAWAAEHDLSLLEAVGQADRIPTLGPAARGALGRFRGQTDQIRRAAAICSGVAPLLEQIMEITGYRQWLLDSPDPYDRERLENLRELVAAASEYDGEADPGSPAGFLEEVALYRRTDEGGDPDRIQLMTLHSAKGLEFPVVFIAGCEQDLIPHERSQDTEEQLEEERRLLYVGITRAKRRLFLCHASWRDRFNQTEHCAPSMFLEEIDPSLLLPAGGAAPSLDEEDEDAPDFAVGQRVRHAYFGVGTVIELDGRGRRRKARVRFDDGVRSLALEHAGLVAVS